MKLQIQASRWILMLAISISTSTVIRADVVTDWNEIAVQATSTGARPGPSGVLDLAMVHAAIYDAVQAIESRFRPYYVEIPGASGSPVAAAAKAAHDVLVHRFPMQATSLNTTYQQYLLNQGLSETDPGVEVGARAAAGIIALRGCDGSFPNPPPPPFVGGTGLGVWRPTPPNNLAMAIPWLGNVTPFLLTRPSQFRADPPPALTSRKYARDYNEVKALGALNNSARTPEQTDLAHFFAGNTLVIWNRAVREIALTHIDNVSDSSRLFALVSMAVADSLITAWNDKSFYVFWRPITAIQQGDNDNNPRTAGDPTWVSLITNPNYPDHTSGANAFASAVNRSLARFFRTNQMTFSVTTTNTNSTIEDTRTYHSFPDAAQDVVDARVYSGIHFRFADEAARKQGRQVADWAFKHFFRPIGNNENGEDGGEDDFDRE